VSDIRRWACAGSASAVRWRASRCNAFIRTATEIAKDGKFDGFANLISNPELNTFFSEDRKKGAS